MKINHTEDMRELTASELQDSDPILIAPHVLLGFGAALTLIDNNVETARLAAGIIVSALQLPFGAIVLHTAPNNETRLFGQFKNASPEEVLAEEIKNISTLSDQSSCEIDVQRDHLPETAAAGLYRLRLVRLATVEHDFGFLIAGKPSEDAYSPAQVASLEFLSAQTSIALHRIQLNKNLAAKEAALRESEERFRCLSEASFEGIAITERGKLLDASEQFFEMFGYKLEEVIGMIAVEFVVPESRDLVSKNIRVKYEEPYEFLGLRKDGSTFQVEAHSKTIPYGGRDVRVTAVRDVSERKLAEEEVRKARDELEIRVKERTAELSKAIKRLKESEERYRNLYLKTPAVLHSIDAESKLVSVSDFWLEKFGYTREEVMGRKSVDFLTEESRKFAITEAIPQMKRQGYIRELPFQFVKKNDEIIDTLLSATVELDENGNYLRSLAVLEDVTERKQAEEALQKAHDELEIRVKERTTELSQANELLSSKNEELESFAYSVSHDLRTPLRGIDGFSQALLEDYSSKLDTRGKDYLNRVRAASQRMGHLIDDMLHLSRVSRREMIPKKVDLSAMAKTITEELCEKQSERQVTFVITPEVEVSGDVHLLRIALENLLDNAWKYTSKHPQAKIEFGVTEHEGKKAYFVRDDGAGFDTKFVGKLFGPFQRLHRSDEFEGNGIGLATVQRIIHRHGGRVWAEGAVEKGATFFFTLP